MSKVKNILLLAAVGGVIYTILNSNKQEKYTTNELEKIEKYKKYLEDKNFVIVDKSKFDKLSKKNNKKLLSLSSMPKYYAVAKTIAKFAL